MLRAVALSQCLTAEVAKAAKPFKLNSEKPNGLGVLGALCGEVFRQSAGA